MRKFIVLTGFFLSVGLLQNIEAHAAEEGVSVSSGDVFDPNSDIPHQDILDGYYAPGEEEQSDPAVEIATDGLQTPQKLVDCWTYTDHVPVLIKGHWYENKQSLAVGAHYNSFVLYAGGYKLTYRYHYTLTKESGKYCLHRRHVTCSFDGSSTFYDLYDLNGYNITNGEATIFGIGVKLTSDEKNTAPYHLTDRQTSKSTINGDDNIDALFSFINTWKTSGKAGIFSVGVEYKDTYHVHCKIWQEHRNLQTHIRIMID